MVREGMVKAVIAGVVSIAACIGLGVFVCVVKKRGEKPQTPKNVADTGVSKNELNGGVLPETGRAGGVSDAFVDKNKVEEKSSEGGEGAGKEVKVNDPKRVVAPEQLHEAKGKLKKVKVNDPKRVVTPEQLHEAKGKLKKVQVEERSRREVNDPDPEENPVAYEMKKLAENRRKLARNRKAAPAQIKRLENEYIRSAVVAALERAKRSSRGYGREFGFDYIRLGEQCRTC